MPERRPPRRGGQPLPPPPTILGFDPHAPLPSPEEREKPRRAAAIRYEGGTAPIVVAAGSGETAERIERLALENDVPVERDGPLAEALARLPVDSEIPPELYRAVAEVLIWARGVEIAARAEQAADVRA
ncbi:MAG: EscU/YscU/HrcU family type III secretion system export apparatus switch protein [Solirubrobacteraceae bacterium]